MARPGDTVGRESIVCRLPSMECLEVCCERFNVMKIITELFIDRNIVFSE
jgi:hypothetical protein